MPLALDNLVREAYPTKSAALRSKSRFTLLRRFSVVSLMAMLATATLLIIMYRQDQLAEHTIISRDENERTLSYLTRSLDNQINDYISISAGLEPQILRKNTILDTLFATGLGEINETDILKLKIYNLSGTVIYSTTKSEIGGTSYHPDLLARALSGETVYRMEHRDSFSGNTGELNDLEVASTYMPLTHAGKPIGAIELYDNATQLFDHIFVSSIRIAIAVIGIFGCLYAALFFAISRTERDIVKWQNSIAGMAADLQESENRRHFLEQQQIVQTSLDGYWVADIKDGKILEVNEAYCNMTGYPQQELLTMYISDLEAVETPVEIASHINKIIAQGYDRFETVHRHKNGHLINIEASVSYLTMDGGRMIAFVRDLTKRYQAEEALRQSFEEIEDLYNDAACGYHSLNKEGVICRMNDTELRWLGYTREEVLGKMKFADFLSPDDAQAFWKKFPVLQIDGFMHDIECEIIRKDGRVMVGLINASAIYDTRGNYLMSQTTVVDITQRKRAEKLSRDLANHLEIVREEEKAKFAREIHDELGSTLSAIKMDIDMLDAALPAYEKILPVQERIKSMADLVDTALMDTRRIITDLRPPMLDYYGLLAAIRWQADQFQKRTGIECSVTCPCAEVSDCERKLDNSVSIALFRIFQEALTNVARHSGASRVDVNYSPGNDEVILSISDNGRGLSEDHTIASTSYGLRGMQERVEHCGGQIMFGCPPGGGFSVRVCLPLPVETVEEPLEGSPTTGLESILTPYHN